MEGPEVTSTLWPLTSGGPRPSGLCCPRSQWTRGLGRAWSPLSSAARGSVQEAQGGGSRGPRAWQGKGKGHLGIKCQHGAR